MKIFETDGTPCFGHTAGMTRIGQKESPLHFHNVEMNQIQTVEKIEH